MPVLKRSSALLACAASAAAFVAVVPSAAAAGAHDVIPSGRCLIASAKHPVAALQSTSAEFELVLTRASLRIHDEVLLTDNTAAGYTTWRRTANRVRGTSASLCMQKDGNLVLRGDGKVTWSSRTAGTGSANYATVRDTGSLVVRTAQGRRLWSSNTTSVLLAAGDQVRSGHTLRNATDPAAVTRLTMQSGGDLVLTRAATLLWHSDTHVKGAYLDVTTNGQLTVRTATLVLWRSSAVGTRPLLTVDRGRLTMVSYTSGHCWVRPAAGCG